MAFVKLDTGILDSSLWPNRDSRDVFITALLMALPHEFKEPVEVYEVGSTGSAGWSLEPGWYGFIKAAGSGIVRRADVPREAGALALAALASPDPESRSTGFEGRRMARIDGGWVILNFMRYRDKDHTGAERAKRYRERKKQAVTRDTSHPTRDVTQSEAEAEAEAPTTTPTGGEGERHDAKRRRTADTQRDARHVRTKQAHPGPATATEGADVAERVARGAEQDRGGGGGDGRGEAVHGGGSARSGDPTATMGSNETGGGVGHTIVIREQAPPPPKAKHAGHYFSELDIARRTLGGELDKEQWDVIRSARLAQSRDEAHDNLSFAIDAEGYEVVAAVVMWGWRQAADGKRQVKHQCATFNRDGGGWTHLLDEYRDANGKKPAKVIERSEPDRLLEVDGIPLDDEDKAVWDENPRSGWGWNAERVREARAAR